LIVIEVNEHLATVRPPRTLSPEFELLRDSDPCSVKVELLPFDKLVEAAGAAVRSLVLIKEG
jgi:hypothetical protein